MARFLIQFEREMFEKVGQCSRPAALCRKCSNAPRKSLSLTHSVPQMPQSKKRHTSKVPKSIASLSQLVWRGHCCGGGGVSHQMRSAATESSNRMHSSNDRHAICIRTHRLSSWAVWLAMVLGLAACGPMKAAEPPSPEMAALYPTLADNPKPALVPYVLQVGDELAIKFYTNPELNEDVKVRSDGMISLQLVDDVQAAGSTPSQLDAELTKRYTGELADPQISVIVKTPGGERVYVAGEVGKQGVLALVGGMTLYQALQDAGGFTETAHRKQVLLIRKGPDGVPVGKVIDVRQVEDGKNPALDIPLRPLDIVFVPRSKIANVDLFVKQYIRDALPIQTLPIPF